MKPPQCSLCNRQVDKFEWFRDQSRDVMVYRAYCHGDVEEVRLSYFMLEDATDVQIITAFNKPRLSKVDAGDTVT